MSETILAMNVRRIAIELCASVIERQADHYGDKTCHALAEMLRELQLDVPPLPSEGVSDG